MSLMETAKLFPALTRGCARLAVDAVGDVSGSSMPYRVDTVATPEGLARLINEGAVQSFDRLEPPTEVEVMKVVSPSSNCRNVTLRIGSSGDSRLPETLFLKLPMESLVTRWFMNVIGSWELESHVSGALAADLPIRTPVTFATAHRGSRFFLLQENLLADPSVHLFNNFDMRDGPSHEIVLRCLDTFARLHSHYCGASRESRERLLPSRFHLFLSRELGSVSRYLNKTALAPCMRRAPTVIPEAVCDVYRRSIDHWDELLAYWFAEPLCLVHGDSHLGNFFVSGDEMGMLDWQATHWGKGVRDVQYFLINSLPSDRLAASERDYLAHYVERRAHYGSALDPQSAWEEYRAFSFHTLFTLVVSVGLGALNADQGALMRENLRRAVAAVQRVDYGGWLDDYLAAWGNTGRDE